MRTIVLLAAMMGLGSCQKTSIGEAGSDLSDLAFTLPEGAGTLYTGYSVSFARHGASQSDDNCSANKSWVSATSDRNVTIQHSVKNGCDYLIGLELGKVNAAESELEKVFYTNRGVEPGTVVTKSQLTGGTVPVTIKVYKTQDAPADAPGELQTRDFTELNIEVVFDNGENVSNEPNRGPGPPPPAETPTPELTAFEQSIQDLKILSYTNQEQNFWDLVKGKKYFLVRHSLESCAPCKGLQDQVARDTELRSLPERCAAVTSVVSVSGRLEREYSPASAFQKNAQQIEQKLGSEVVGYPTTIIFERATGKEVERGTGLGGIDVYKKFAQICNE